VPGRKPKGQETVPEGTFPSGIPFFCEAFSPSPVLTLVMLFVSKQDKMIPFCFNYYNAYYL